MVDKIIRFFKDKRAVLLVLLIVLSAVLQLQSDKYHNWDNKEQLDRTIVRSDGAGYYAYLPQHFIYHDPDYFFIDSLEVHYPNSKIGEFGNYAHPDEGRMDKFFPGVAICQTPFFLIAHWLHSSKYSSDGYSYPYQKAIAIGAICFLLLGVFLTYLILIRIKISPLAAAISLTGVALGTPLLYYTVNEPLASHVYSFAAIALFLYLILVWRDSRNAKWIPLIALLLGLIVLLRPVNGIIVLLYFAIFPSLKDAWHFLRNNLFNSIPKLALALLCFSSVVIVQFMNVYYQTGNFDFNLYSIETFENWNDPPIGKVLFGFRKGLFPYAPLCLFAFLGLIFSFKKYRFQSLVIVLFFLLFTYITSAWWCWWYGGSLGMRPMIDISIVFILGLTFILEKGRIYLKTIAVSVIGFCIYFQFILSHQIANGILHFSEMNKEMYEYIFLKTDKRFQWLFYIDHPKRFEKNVTHSKTYYWNNELNSFAENRNEKQDTFETEHMTESNLFKYDIDSTKINQQRGIRLEGNMTLRDKNNIPIFIVHLDNGETWEQPQNDFIGMLIPELNEPTHFTSDYIFTDSISKYKSISLQMMNSHGKTTIENFQIHIISK